MGILDRLMFWRNRPDNDVSDEIAAMDGFEVAGCFTGPDDLVNPGPDADSESVCPPESAIVDETI